MIKVFIYLLITFFLDNLLNNLNVSGYFIPHLVLSSLIISYLILRDNNKFIVLSLITFFIYDILYFNNFYNIISFLIITYTIIFYFKTHEINILNIIILTIIVIFIYNFIIFLISILYLNNNYEISFFFNKFTHSIIINLVYNILSYYIFCNNKSYFLSKKTK